MSDNGNFPTPATDLYKKQKRQEWNAENYARRSAPVSFPMMSIVCDLIQNSDLLSFLV